MWFVRALSGLNKRPLYSANNVDDAIADFEDRKQMIDESFPYSWLVSMHPKKKKKKHLLMPISVLPIAVKLGVLETSPICIGHCHVQACTVE